MPGWLVMIDTNIVAFHAEIYRNQLMTAAESREWLNSTTVGDPIVMEVLTKIGAGEYPSLLDQMDAFIKILATSKHNENGTALLGFAASMVESTLSKIDLRRHSFRIADALLKNANWNADKHRQTVKRYDAWRSSRCTAKRKRL